MLPPVDRTPGSPALAARLERALDRLEDRLAPFHHIVLNTSLMARGIAEIVSCAPDRDAAMRAAARVRPHARLATYPVSRALVDSLSTGSHPPMVLARGRVIASARGASGRFGALPYRVADPASRLHPGPDA